MTVHPQAQAILDMLARAPVPLREMAPAAARAAYDRIIAAGNFELDAVGRVEDRTIDGPHGPLGLRVIWPADAPDGPLPVFVFFHGGGFVIGSVESREPQLRKIANGAPCIAVGVRYRLSPEAKFPAATEEAWAAVRWVAGNAAALGGDPARLAVGGDSAGGNLACVVTQQARRAGGPAISFQLLVYPATDFLFAQDLPSYALADGDYFITREQIAWYRSQYFPDGVDPRDIRHSPAFAPDLAGLPPALIVAAEYDPLRDDGRRYGERLRTAGVDAEYVCYDGMIHGFWHYGKKIDAAGAALAKCIAALAAAFAA